MRAGGGINYGKAISFLFFFFFSEEELCDYSVALSAVGRSAKKFLLHANTMINVFYHHRAPLP